MADLRQKAPLTNVINRQEVACAPIGQSNDDEPSVIGAGPWEHSPDRAAHRNEYRPRLLSTPAAVP